MYNYMSELSANWTLSFRIFYFSWRVAIRFDSDTFEFTKFDIFEEIARTLAICIAISTNKQ